MRISYQIGADSRAQRGKGSSRRLRRGGKVPAVLYGGGGEPRNLVLDQQQLLTIIDREKFYSSIVQLNIDSQPHPAIVRDVQMHPARNTVVHVDLQRVVETEKLRIRLPIHFRGEGVAPGVKTQGGIISHMVQDVEVSCLPADLPEYLELDVSGMHLNDALSLSDIPLPSGVSIPLLSQGRNLPVVLVHSPRAAEPEAAAATAPGAAGAPAAVPAGGAATATAASPTATGAQTAAPAAAAAAGAKKEEPKKKPGGKKEK